MVGIKIVTDSSITIAPEVVEELGITIVPLSVMVDGVIYSDKDLKEGEFLELMRSSKNLPKTSQPPVGLFAEVFADLASDGSSIIAIHLSHALSGTVEASRQGAMLSGVDVTVLDSNFVDQALAFQVETAARMAKDGASKEDILAMIEAIKSKTALYLGLSTLENLVKGGRIDRVTGLISSFLHIRVIMQMVDNVLHPIVKGRGAKTFKKWMDEFKQGQADERIARIGISYAGNREFAERLKMALDSLVSQEIRVLETSSIVQTHTGEDAWAILVEYE